MTPSEAILRIVNERNGAVGKKTLLHTILTRGMVPPRHRKQVETTLRQMLDEGKIIAIGEARNPIIKLPDIELEHEMVAAREQAEAAQEATAPCPDPDYTIPDLAELADDDVAVMIDAQEQANSVTPYDQLPPWARVMGMHLARVVAEEAEGLLAAAKRREATLIKERDAAIELAATAEAQAAQARQELEALRGRLAAILS